MKRRAGGIVLSCAIALTASGAPGVASAPDPVLPVEFVEDLPPKEYDPTEPYRDDQDGRCPAGNTRTTPGGVLELNGPPSMRGVPSPVVPVGFLEGPAAKPCLTEIGLSLLIEAPGDKKPDGANGTLDEISVPRPSLESGFEVTLPAQDRLITLSDPGENWELKSTSCSCSGVTGLSASGGSGLAAAPSAAASYPGPVLPVDALPFDGGPGGCNGAAPVGFSAVAAAVDPVPPVTPSLRTAFPGPVIPVSALPRLQAPRVEWDDAGTITITDPDLVGGTFTCVWTVELLYGRLDIETVTKPSGEEARFEYEVVPTGGQPDASALTMRGGSSERLRWGPWSVELGALPEGWKVRQSSCSESDISLISLANGSSATVGLDQDDAVRCRFELELLAPKPGRWRANERAGTAVCSARGYSIPFDLSQAVDFARMQVRDEGDTLVVRGGGNRFTFRRDRNDPLRYVGSKRFRGSGVTLEFQIRLDLKSETRMTGNVRAVGKGRGAKCTWRRPLTVTHVSD